MARLPRIVVPGQALHILQRGNNRQTIFFDASDYHFYIDSLYHAIKKFNCTIHAYVLMTNHVHILLTPETVDGPSKVMQSVGRDYVRHFNHLYQRSGTLWEGRYRSALVDAEHYLLTCSRYIELNPVRAGLVELPDQYPWSSYHCNGFGGADACVTPHPVYLSLGKSRKLQQKNYRSLFNLSLSDDELCLIRENTQKNAVIGTMEFQNKISEIIKHRIAKHTHGGDRRSDCFKKVSRTLTP